MSRRRNYRFALSYDVGAAIYGVLAVVSLGAGLSLSSDAFWLWAASFAAGTAASVTLCVYCMWEARCSRKRAYDNLMRGLDLRNVLDGCELHGVNFREFVRRAYPDAPTTTISGFYTPEPDEQDKPL